MIDRLIVSLTLSWRGVCRNLCCCLFHCEAQTSRRVKRASRAGHGHGRHQAKEETVDSWQAKGAPTEPLFSSNCIMPICASFLAPAVINAWRLPPRFGSSLDSSYVMSVRKGKVNNNRVPTLKHTINDWIFLHSHEEVGIPNPLYSLIDIGDSPERYLGIERIDQPSSEPEPS